MTTKTESKYPNNLQLAFDAEIKEAFSVQLVELRKSRGEELLLEVERIARGKIYDPENRNSDSISYNFIRGFSNVLWDKVGFF